jgi:hypothetical protein
VPWSIRWPTSESDFVQTSLPNRVVEILRCTQNTNVSWTDQDGNKWNWVLLDWAQGQDLNIYVGGHNPEVCMGGNGLVFLKKVEPVAVKSGNLSMRFHHRLFEKEHELIHVFQGTWEPLVPPTGQRLFGDNTFHGRLRNVLERRLIRGGITLEIALSGSDSTEDATLLLRKLMQQLVIETQPGQARRR